MGRRRLPLAGIGLCFPGAAMQGTTNESCHAAPARSLDGDSDGDGDGGIKPRRDYVDNCRWMMAYDTRQFAPRFTPLQYVGIAARLGNHTY